MFVGESCTGPAYRIRDGFDGFVLADHPLVEGSLHVKKLLLLALQHLAHGDARPAGHDLCDIFGGHGLCHDRVFDSRLLLKERIYLLLGLGHLAVTQLRDLAIVAFALRDFGLMAKVLELLTGRLYLTENAFLFVPALPELSPLGLLVGEVLVYLLALERHTLALDSLLLDLELADGAVELCDRLRH